METGCGILPVRPVSTGLTGLNTQAAGVAGGWQVEAGRWSGSSLFTPAAARDLTLFLLLFVFLVVFFWSELPTKLRNEAEEEEEPGCFGAAVWKIRADSYRWSLQPQPSKPTCWALFSLLCNRQLSFFPQNFSLNQKQPSCGFAHVSSPAATPRHPDGWTDEWRSGWTDGCFLLRRRETQTG